MPGTAVWADDPAHKSASNSLEFKLRRLDHSLSAIFYVPRDETSKRFLLHAIEIMGGGWVLIPLLLMMQSQLFGSTLPIVLDRALVSLLLISCLMDLVLVALIKVLPLICLHP